MNKLAFRWMIQILLRVRDWENWRSLVLKIFSSDSKVRTKDPPLTSAQNLILIHFYKTWAIFRDENYLQVAHWVQFWGGNLRENEIINWSQPPPLSLTTNPTPPSSCCSIASSLKWPAQTLPQSVIVLVLCLLQPLKMIKVWLWSCRLSRPEKTFQS